MTNPRDDLMALADEAEQLVNMGVLNLPLLRSVKLMREMASALRLAASRPATQVVDREAVARALCESGKFETGEGTCSLLCMDQLGSVRKKGCNHLTRVHGKLVDSILSLLRPAEPVEAIQTDTVAQRTWFDGENVRTENLTADDIYQKPDATPDAVGEPVAWIITWSDGETSFTRSAPSASSPKNCKYQPLYTHPPTSPDTSAAVLQRVALEQALNSLAEIASSHIPDCPAHYAGEELAWAQRHVGCLRQKAEIARDGIAAAIRQLPTPERGDK